MTAAEVYKHPYRICNPDGDLQFIILCDHATNAIPPGYNNLGLTDDQLAQHIAWDIGAAKTAEMIGDRLDCPVILAGFSRLLIDANRGIDDPTLVMQLSDGEVIEGNLDIHPARQCAEKRPVSAVFMSLITPKLSIISSKQRRRVKCQLSYLCIVLHPFGKSRNDPCLLRFYGTKMTACRAISSKNSGVSGASRCTVSGASGA